VRKGKVSPASFEHEGEPLVCAFAALCLCGEILRPA
jgi:hypothetical protein